MEHPQALIAELKERTRRNQKGNVTLFVSVEVWKAFQKKCESEGIKPGELLEDFMKATCKTDANSSGKGVKKK